MSIATDARLQDGAQQSTAAPRRPFRLGSWLAWIVIATAIGAGLLAPWIAPHDPEAVHLVDRLRPPVWADGGTTEYLLGTDHQGRDVLSRVIWGTRVSLSVAAASIALGAVAGTLLGLLAGYFGGVADVVVGRGVDITLALPAILLALVLAVAYGPGFLLVVFVIALGLTAKYARLVRGEVLSLREEEFVALAKVAGASSARIIAVHLLPNTLNSIVVLSALQIGFAMVVEATLSFLGVGIPPPTPSWGTILSEGQRYLSTGWWISVSAGLAMMSVILAANTLGDALRDRLDPKVRQL